MIACEMRTISHNYCEWLEIVIDKPGGGRSAGTEISVDAPRTSIFLWKGLRQLFLLYPSLFIRDQRMVIHQQLLTRALPTRAARAPWPQ
jgi:hypothetical protein